MVIYQLQNTLKECGNVYSCEATSHNNEELTATASTRMFSWFDDIGLSHEARSELTTERDNSVTH